MSARTVNGSPTEPVLRCNTSSQNPGISVSELGKKMKLNHPNYLYRVLPDLQKEGRIRRRGKGYHPGKS